MYQRGLRVQRKGLRMQQKSRRVLQKTRRVQQNGRVRPQWTVRVHLLRRVRHFFTRNVAQFTVRGDFLE